VQTKICQDLRADPIITKIGLETKLQIGFNCVTASILETISLNLVEQPNTSTLLIQIQQHSPAVLLNDLHCGVELIATIAPQRAQRISGQTSGMDANERRLPALDSSLHQRDVGHAVDLIFEGDRLEFSKGSRQPCTRRPFDEGFPMHPVFDQGLHRHHLQLMGLGKLRQLRHTSHRPVGIHDLADYSGRLEPGQPCQINRPFRLSGTPKHAPVCALSGNTCPGRARSLGLHFESIAT